MDFGSLLHVAKKNENVKKEVKYYSTKFEPPKKEQRDKTQLSINIQKFLAKKEEEERQKALEAKRKRDELLAKRDPKLKKKILKHLKVCKSANKSVLADAIDNENTAVTIQGMEQPDEDDYGFVSEAASAYHNKIMEKYYSKPEEKKFSDRIKNVNNDLNGIKDRVRAAIEREKEEALLPHKRHRKTKAEMAALNGGTDDCNLNFGRSVLADSYSNEPERKLEVKPKPKRPPMPPPLDYTQLLKIAEQKKDEPIKIEPKIEKKEPERLMTSKERREFEEMQARIQGRKQRDLDRMQAMKNKSKGGGSEDKRSSSKSKPGEEQKPKPVVNNPSGRIPKLNGYKPKPEADRQSKPSSNDTQMRPKSSQVSKPSLNNSNSKPMTNGSAKSAPQKSQVAESRSSIKSSSQKLNGDTRSSDKLQSKPRMVNGLNKSRDLAMKEKSRPEVTSKPVNGDSKPKLTSKGNPSSNAPAKQFPPADTKAPSRQFPPSDTKPKSRSFPPADTKQATRQFPPNDIKGSRQFPPNDLKSSRQFPPKDVRPAGPKKKIVASKRRILDDDDSEYDSELDDFIDDGPEDGNDYSKYIKDIFGYDKSRYRDEDDDDINMESNFAQVMREEYISKKIGIMEDLEDMKMEAMEKKMKAAKKKRLK